MNESDILQQVRQWLQHHGWFVIRIHQGLGCHKGISDLIAVKGGVTAFIEIKGIKGWLSDYQEQFQAEIKHQGGIYIVARGIEDVATLIEKGDSNAHDKASKRFKCSV